MSSEPAHPPRSSPSRGLRSDIHLRTPSLHTGGYGSTIRYRMEMRKPARSSLTPADWAVAAFRAVARGGVDAVAVERIAAELGATKGSFYWHFKNRDALIEAALDEWERRLTENVIERLEREPDPGQRLKKLLAAEFQPGPDGSRRRNRPAG